MDLELGHRSKHVQCARKGAGQVKVRWLWEKIKQGLEVADIQALGHE